MVPPYSVNISRVPTYSISLMFAFVYGTITLYRCPFQNIPLTPTSLRANSRSLAATNEISVDFFSSGYLDVSVLPVRLLYLCIQYKIPDLHRVGLPIQISPDHRLFTTSPKLFAGYHVFHRL